MQGMVAVAGLTSIRWPQLCTTTFVAPQPERDVPRSEYERTLEPLSVDILEDRIAFVLEHYPSVPHATLSEGRAAR